MTSILRNILLLLFLTSVCLAKEEIFFTDKDLKSYLAENSTGIIYITSPHMYLALKGQEEYSKIAKDKKIPFLVLVDPNATIHKNMLNLDLTKFKKLNSKEIINRDATHHFPSYIFYKNGKLEGKFNPGYDSPEKFTERLNRYFYE